MIAYLDKIVVNYEKMELAAEILKKISKYAEGSDNPDYFSITDQSLRALNDGVNMALVRSWFLINVIRASGEEINLYRDADGEKLSPDKKYYWDVIESAFSPKDNGDFGVNEIKLLRLMMTSKLDIVSRVKNSEGMMPKILRLAEIIAKH